MPTVEWRLRVGYPLRAVVDRDGDGNPITDEYFLLMCKISASIVVQTIRPDVVPPDAAAC
jgi:hypothetical protein